jgi:hypothetical protein
MAVTMKNGSSGMLRHVAVVRTDVSEELSASFIRATRIGVLGTLTVTSYRRTLRRVLVTDSVVPTSQILVALMKEAPFFRVDLLFPSPDDGNRSSFRNVEFYSS